MIKRIYFLNIKLETGGPENIHQVCKILSQYGYDASIFYGDGIAKHPSRFQCYDNKITIEPIIDEDTLFVFPEFLPASKFKHLSCKKALFWLSLDNSPDIKQLKLKEYLEDCGINYNFAQSQYAFDYLKSYDIDNVFMLSDYLNDKYFESRPKKERKPYVLYNPKKGIEFTQKIIHLNEDIKFIPIQGMNVDQVIDLMDESMVYIDFGEHPGKDRIPREAAMRNLIVITNRNGAAVNDIDVPIGNEFKVDNNISMLGKVKNMIHNSIENYENECKKFDSYRELIKRGKDQLQESVMKTFGEIQLV